MKILKSITAIFLVMSALILSGGCGEDSVSERAAGLSGEVTILDPSQVNVLLLGQDVDGGFPFVQGFLSPFGFPVLDTFDNSAGTPTLADLTPYHTVFFWPNDPPADSVALGDALAAYVDGGGGVVIATPGHLPGFGPGGNFSGGAYSPFNFDATGANLSSVTLGTIYQPGHPILDNVVTLGSTLRDDPTFSGAGVLIADWSDGIPLVAVNDAGTVAGITFFPISSGDMSGDYDVLIANTLAYTASF